MVAVAKYCMASYPCLDADGLTTVHRGQIISKVSRITEKCIRGGERQPSSSVLQQAVEAAGRDHHGTAATRRGEVEDLAPRHPQQKSSRPPPQPTEGAANSASDEESHRLGTSISDAEVEALVQKTRDSPRYRSDFRFLQNNDPSAARHHEGLSKTEGPPGQEQMGGSSHSVLAVHCTCHGGTVRTLAVSEAQDIVLDFTVSLRHGDSHLAEAALCRARAALQRHLGVRTALVAHGARRVLEILQLQHSRIIDTSHLLISGQNRSSLDVLAGRLLPDKAILADASVARPAKLAMAVVLSLAKPAKITSPKPPPRHAALWLPQSLEEGHCLRLHRLSDGTDPQQMVREMFGASPPPGLSRASLWVRAGRRGADLTFATLPEALAAFDSLPAQHGGVDSGGYPYKDLQQGWRIRSAGRVPEFSSFRVHLLPPGATRQAVAELLSGAAPDTVSVMPYCGRTATALFPSLQAARRTFNLLQGQVAVDSGGYPVKTLPCGVKVKWDIPMACLAAQRPETACQPHPSLVLVPQEGRNARVWVGCT